MFSINRFHLTFSSRRLSILFACLAVVLSTSGSASGAVLDALGFETPDYTAGNLQGQQDWSLIHLGAAPSTAVVQNTVVESGSQALKVDRSPNTNDRWAVPVGSVSPQRFINIDWDMRVVQTPAGSGFGPFLGVEAYDDNGIFGLLGSLGVDASTGDILYQFEDTGVFTDTGTLAAFDQWQHYQVQLDFQTNTYSAFLDGNLLVTTGFVDRGGVGGTNLDEFTDADISALAAAPDSVSQGLTGTAYFDNFIITDPDALDGDFNNNGTVDAADYTVWLDTLGGDNESVLSRNGNGSGGVDNADYLLWKTNFGLTSGVGTNNNSTVPEPASTMLFLLAGVMLGIRRKPIAR